MSHEITSKRMAALATREGWIGVEGEGYDTEMVVRIPMSAGEAEEVYDDLCDCLDDRAKIVLNPDMTLSEVADIIELAESDVWTEYVEPSANWSYKKLQPNKRTLRDASPLEGFYMFVDRGSSEGIYLTIKGLDKDGVGHVAFVCKTLYDPMDDHWFKCWASAGRIARAFDEMQW